MSYKYILCAIILGLMVCCTTSQKAPHVVFVTGDDEYRSEITLPMIADILEKRHGFKCSVAYATDPATRERNPKFQQNIEGLDTLGDADLAVFFMRFRALPDDQLNAILNYVNSGKPIVGLRTSTHAFRYPEGPNAKWNDGFGIEVFGQKWITHHGHTSSTEVTPIPQMADHPILRGIQVPFSCASWLYHVTPLVGDCEPLLVGLSMNSEKKPEELEQYPLTQPVAWTKTFTGSSGKPARVFFTTLGHPQDFENEAMRRLLINGIFWALGMEEKIPSEGSNARPIGEFTAPPTH
ncbi:MAG TPA: ThuA domain-containing protein [bacterium]|nr:ThuA domain-containing protein [bacterium]